MFKWITATIMAVIVVGTVTGMSRGTDTAVRATPQKAQAKHERCWHARNAVPYYRTATHGWQAKRDGELADPTPRVRGRSCHWARYAADEWVARSSAARETYTAWVERQKALEREHPKWIALRLLDNDREQWDCLMYISSVENARMDPTLDFGGGHGNVYEAYGIPQAFPGTKMASAGPDWRTNPETQLRWMIDYCRGRYGSVCGAAYHRRAYGTY